ncbi:MAG: DHA2 family efflux MFS transporter permease subunit [Acidobacteriia bacterium]|nr:DHA2 family efflux MFS transporter permease subunit [Terriglobia bacterium]
MRSEIPQVPTPVNPWIIAISVMLATFMEVLDTTVVNVSLPHIAGSMSASVDEATWTLTSYLVANAIILPLTGWLANYLGRKRLLMMAVTGFTAASFMCGLAWNLASLILFRVIQGMSGGALQPLSQAVLLETFPPRERGKAMGFWALGIVVAPILGPVVGGWLTDNYTWRWVFYINIPVGLLSLLMTKTFIFDPAYIRRSSARIDFWGIGFLAVGIASLQVLLDKGQELDWFGSAAIRYLTLIAAVGLIAFVIRELTTSDPVVRLRVLKVATYSAGVFLMTMLGFVLYGSLILVPILLQTLMGYPALEAGIAMAPRGMGSFIANPIVGVMVGRVGPRKLLALGLAAGAATLFWLGSVNLSAGYWSFFWPQFIQGVSLALLFVPLTTVTMSPIPKEEMGNATSIFNLMRNLGGSFGIATGTTILDRRIQKNTDLLGRHVNAGGPLTESFRARLRSAFIMRGIDPAAAKIRANAALFGMVQRQAAMLSFIYVFRFLGLVFLLMLPLVLIMKSPKQREESGDAEAH